MRIDKFLKVSRVIKRRSVAQEACDGGRIEINGKAVKPAKEVKIGDKVTVTFGCIFAMCHRHFRLELDVVRGVERRRTSNQAKRGNDVSNY